MSKKDLRLRIKA